MMKSVKQSLLERTSVRRYEREPIPESTMQLIYEAIRNTPTSYNGQQFSVIDIDDPQVKEALYEITGQKQVKTCSHFLIFCLDYNKMNLLAQAKGVEMPPFLETLDAFTVGCVDASLAMMSALVAAESEGLGACCVGYVRTADPRAVASLLGIPQGVFVVCGVALGIPRETPDLKPKQPASLLIHHNRYREDDMVDELKAYDEQVHHYNMTRQGSKTDHDWCAHIVDYYREASRYEMLRALREQGLDVVK